MIGVDTNVLVRFFVEDRDTPEHTDRARRALAARIEAGELVFVPVSVLTEVIWVLVRTVKHPKDQTADLVDALLMTPEVLVHERGAVQRALLRWRNGPADFADYLALELTLSAGGSELLTFDKKLLRAPGTREP